MDLGLSGKRIAVVGAGRGIGRAIALAFAEEGASLALGARTKTDLEDVAVAARARGAVVIAQQLDATDVADVANWADGAVHALGGLDAVIWNVSVQSREWAITVSADVVATVAGIETLVPHVERAGNGSIVLIGSQAAHHAVPGYASYSAGKAALLSYSGSLARGLASRGIRVNTVSPSEVYHPASIWSRLERERPDKFADARARSPLGRMCAPEDVAAVVVFLVSCKASFISGINLLVDGMGREHINF